MLPQTPAQVRQHRRIRSNLYAKHRVEPHGQPAPAVVDGGPGSPWSPEIAKRFRGLNPGHLPGVSGHLHDRPEGGDIPPSRTLLLHHAAHGRRPWRNGGVADRLQVLLGHSALHQLKPPLTDGDPCHRPEESCAVPSLSNDSHTRRVSWHTTQLWIIRW